jgi:hypothetical protein
MKKDGCLYDLVFVAPPDHFVEGAADFGRFVAGTHTHSSSTSAESAPLSGRGDP